MVLMKFTLSFTVVFTCVLCYLLAPNILFNFKMVVILFLAGMFVTGSASAINQIVEKDTDANMKRTADRPVASGRMSSQHASIFAAIVGCVGIGMMYYYFNLNSALLSAFSLFFYAFVYTPLKKVNSIAVLAGAIPGALPCLIGWVAATDLVSPFNYIYIGDKGISNVAGWVLFGIQFLWQFPHFWAIAWVAHNDYSRVGFKLLPAEKGPTKFTAMQTVMYSVVMLPVGILPYFLGISGWISLIIVTIANLFLIMQCVRLYIQMDVKAARRVMFSSYIYLPVVFLALLADKVHYI
ncbi:MAG: protoheme IX farnesyltransferase [Pseudopedobacter saltans]|uniref:Protoheme IX farnesyltransferase n=1 Tax=Pseudopedobacter saltans TaxID=151895 RepID=A0A2W5F9J3_9SPHI|nr:MAG: protoheme IX farnesyltransferase [Pseudopedobacter saltans]